MLYTDDTLTMRYKTVKAKKMREEGLEMSTIEDVTELLKSIVWEQSSVMQRCLKLFEMFHSYEAGDMDAHINNTHKLFKKINNKIQICKIVNGVQ